ncbi:conserved hypothetical protein [Leishmania braziliensis MHOM/BR/75/M2904]|uniref:Uncharacterized protein n=1 Tax=Leishmania braziliensis TaxID=5660 RepID=A4HJR2_LEIBR|nr:conserved hypothetical protein [Leishmania braziliensis MHOM/BR/75/M2904]CAJ2478094.1 unnamed protein product [Leishmania braziliensis]CAM42729.2 conserved hypothetical protein [Leishmania braziliensis MHOM/BR/75/M2904]
MCIHLVNPVPRYQVCLQPLSCPSSQSRCRLLLSAPIPTPPPYLLLRNAIIRRAQQHLFLWFVAPAAAPTQASRERKRASVAEAHCPFVFFLSQQTLPPPAAPLTPTATGTICVLNPRTLWLILNHSHLSTKHIHTMRQLKRLDVFPKFDRKFEQDARHRTVSGGIFSVVAIVVILWLLVGEVRYFLSIEEHHEMFVDTEVGGDMRVTVNVTFNHVPCDLITLDAVDVFGVFANDVEDNTVKQRIDAATGQVISAARAVVDEKKVITKAIDADGVEKENCPSCYGAERSPGDCCHTCEDVRQAYAQKGWRLNVDDISVEQCAEDRIKMATAAFGKEGCNLYATFAASRATGSLQFIPGRMYQMLGRRMHDLMGSAARKLDLSHTVHTLEFGERFPGQQNPLDGTAQGSALSGDAKDAMNGRFSYFVKVIPTTYQRYSLITGLQDTVESNQYTATHHFTPSAATKAASQTPTMQEIVPGVFMTYDLSPVRILAQERHPYPSVIHFVLQLCAVCGGVLTVVGLVDSMCFHSVRKVRKMCTGKQL